MVQYRRSRVAGGTYFLTLTLSDRTANHLTQHAEALRAAFRYAREQRPFTVDAIVVMPDHLHLLCTLPEGDADYSERVRLLKRHFSLFLGSARAVPSRGPVARRSVWQSRFWEHTIRDEEDFERHVDYMHFNPVKHGLAHRVADWPYSSFHRYVQDGLLPLDWGGDHLKEIDGEFGE